MNTDPSQTIMNPHYALLVKWTIDFVQHMQYFNKSEFNTSDSEVDCKSSSIVIYYLQRKKG